MNNEFASPYYLAKKHNIVPQYIYQLVAKNKFEVKLSETGKKMIKVSEFEEFVAKRNEAIAKKLAEVAK